jgi:hypothetical protein
MKEHIPELLGIMREEIRLYNDMLECEQRKTELLIGGHVEELMECNKTEEERIVQLRELETKRLSICEDLCRKLEIPREDFTLTRLTESLDGPHGLDEAAALLLDVVQRVQVVGEHNQSLIEKRLRHAEEMVTMVSNAAGPYQPDGTFNLEASVHPTFSQNV